MFNYFLYHLEKYLGTSTTAYCDIETAENDSTLVDDEGGFFSVIALNGSRAIFDTQDLENTVDTMAARLSQIFRASQHQLDIFHHHEPYEEGGYGGEINRLLDGQRQAAQQMGLNVDKLIDAQSRVMQQHTHEEQTYLVLRTHVAHLPKDDLKRANKTRKRMMEATMRFVKGDFAVPTADKNVQMHNMGLSPVISVHESAVKNVVNIFTRMGYYLNVVDSHDALHVMRRTICPERTAPQWRASLPGDPLNVLLPKKDTSIRPEDILHPAMPSQLFPRGLDVRDVRTLKIGRRSYRGLSMDIPPSDIESFGTLLTSLMRADPHMPWRIGWRMFGNGITSDKLRAILLAFLRYVPGPNARIAKALDALEERFNANEAIVGTTFDAVTWVDGDGQEKEELLEARATVLARTVESWGGAQVKEIVGNPAMSWASTVPGLKRTSPSPIAVAPASDVLLMTPMTRSSSPWRGIANCLFRTPDGKLWPYRAYSPVQNAWISLIYAPMGFGKSVMLNAINKGLVLDPENTDLPLVRLLDVGASSTGFINLIKYALPPDRRHQVGYFKMSNTREKAMNPCDLPLGLHKPLAAHANFLVDFLASLCTPLGKEAPEDGVIGVLQRIVDIAYKAAWETAPKSYAEGAEPVVDAAIEKHGIVIDDRSTWYEVRDALFERGEINAAAIAQRCAVPTVPDIAASAMDESVRSAFGEATINNEPLYKYVFRTLSTAIGLYPVLADRTRFGFGDARIVSFDLMDVAHSGTPQADRQTAIMYMIAMRALVNDFAFREEDAHYVPKKYRRHFLDTVDRNNRVPKRFGADEFHRTAACATARAGVLTLIREGRKWRLETVLASQMLSDFDRAMQNLATSIFILGCGNNAAKETAETFGLGNAGYELCEQALHGPGKEGSNFIGVFITKKAKHTALLTLSLSPMELWAYNTTAVDRTIRDALYKMIPVMDALELLAKKFPSGSATEEIERLVAMRMDRGISASAGNFVAEVTNALIKDYSAQSERATLGVDDLFSEEELDPEVTA